MKKLCFALLLTVSAASANASITILHQSEQSYSPSADDCSESGICDLKSYRLVVMKKKVLLPGDADANASFETDVRAVYTTQNTNQIEKYALVQRIRGCQFDSYWDGKTEKRELDSTQDLYGHDVAFIHQDWDIDNDYPGPIYTGLRLANDAIDFFYLLRWNADPNSLDADSSKFYGEEKPPQSTGSATVFATDLPGAEQLYAEAPGLPLHASNSSLEFKTCLFKTRDLPATTDASGKNVPWDQAISCMSWDHKFIYDFKKREFEMPNTPGVFEPICEISR